jgi:hypothetical protein
VLFTVEQIKQLHTLLQEYPEASHITIRYAQNESSDGFDTDAVFIRWRAPHEPVTLGIAKITDRGAW